MLNRLNKFRFPLQEKVGFVLRKTTLRVEAIAVSHACQLEKKWTEKSFAWIFGSEKMDSDPLIPKAIWELNGSERLYDILSIRMN
jgi:L-fucose/D-arabinose isomerase